MTVIYDPRHRALELRQRILESMTAEEIEEYARTHPPEDPIQQPEPETPDETPS